MKLHEPQPENSFYESFSDLIFGTLVLFLVMVMALALQLRQEQSKAQKAESAARLIYEERISGSSTKTRLFIAHVRHEGKLHIAFVPESLSTWWSTTWQPDMADKEPLAYPLQVLCKYFLETREKTFIPYEGFLRMVGGMTEPLASNLVGDERIAGALHLMAHLVLKDPGRDWTPASLAQALGGSRMHPNRIVRQLAAPLRNELSRFYNWQQGLRESNRAKSLVSMTEKQLLARKPEKDGVPPRLRFHASESDVRVGQTTISYRQMASMLRALRSGRGFYLEHLGAAGELEVPPPARFFREVMEPTGYVNRTLSEKGLADLRKRGG